MLDINSIISFTFLLTRASKDIGGIGTGIRYLHILPIPSAAAGSDDIELRENARSLNFL